MRKRKKNNVVIAKAHTKRMRLLLGVLKFFIMVASTGLFLLLFYLAMEIISLF